MTLEQLRIFVTVAETLNMRQAGERLHLTQPAVSAAIGALEARHDARLFDRVGRGLALSAAGRAFLPEAQAVLARVAGAQRVLADLSGLVHGEVRVVASQTVATYWLPGRLARFGELHPGIELALVAGNTSTASDAVLSGDADLGFVEGLVEHDLLRVQRVGGDRLGIYAAPGHPLCGSRVTAEDLRAATWVMREPGSGTRDQLALGLKTLGVHIGELRTRLVLPSNGAMLEAAAAGGIVAAASELAADARLHAGRLVRLDCTLPPRDFAMVTHRGRPPSRAAAAFVESLALGVSARG